MIKIDVSNGNFKIHDLEISHTATDEEIVQSVNKAYNDLPKNAQKMIDDIFVRIIGDYDPKKDFTIKHSRKKYTYFLNGEKTSLSNIMEKTGITFAYIVTACRLCKENPTYKYKKKWRFSREIEKNCSTSNKEETKND